MIQLKTNNVIINHFLRLRMDKGSFPHFFTKNFVIILFNFKVI